MRWVLVVGGVAVLTGCHPSFRLQGRDVPTVVERYQRRSEVVLVSRGARLLVTPAQEPRLRVFSDTCRAPSGQAASDASDCTEHDAPLGDARVVGDSLLLPGAEPLRLSEVTDGVLVMEGDDPRRLHDSRSLPAARARPRSSRASSPLLPAEELPPRRAALGVQLGGSGFVQLVFRYAFVPRYLHLEVGALAWGPEAFLNGSAGLSLELPTPRGFAPYVAVGAGAAYVFGSTDDEPCDGLECPQSSTSEALVFGSGRVGLAKYFGRHRVGVDVGAWLGRVDEDKATGDTGFLWPMAGLSYHYGLGP